MSGQVGNDLDAIKSFVSGEVNYFKKTPNNQILQDAKAFYTNPDNYFQAFENTVAIMGPGAFTKINVTKNFTLKVTRSVETSTGAVETVPSGAQYSVAFEMKLPNNLYPGKGYSSHFKAANTALSNAMASDATFANSMTELGISIPRSPTGNILGKSPTNWVWHHDFNVGMMQLVPKVQHTAGSPFWITLHPGGIGGMSIWGK